MNNINLEPEEIFLLYNLVHDFAMETAELLDGPSDPEFSRKELQEHYKMINALARKLRKAALDIGFNL